MLALLLSECCINKIIGDIVRTREAQRDKGIKNGKKVIYLTRMPDSIARFHNESNSIGEDDYWAKDYFCKYHRKDKSIDLVIVGESK